jgi:hypothetical protein
MRLEIYSYRYAREILEHPNNADAWTEIQSVLSTAPIFLYPGKSKVRRLDIVQQLMNTYMDRRFAVDLHWDYHPLATRILNSGLAADFRKQFSHITIQTEIQFGNMARWYSDIFKFQAAYSQSLIQCALSVVPMGVTARRIDQNIAYYERAVRELPSAELSITLPILMIGIEPDESTAIVDGRACRFNSFKEVIQTENRWRIVNAYINGVGMETVGSNSPTGPMLVDDAESLATEPETTVDDSAS